MCQVRPFVRLSPRTDPPVPTLSETVLTHFPPFPSVGKEGDADYKSDSQFASHMKSNTGASAFSRSKSLREQREYLPAFACREELMMTLRDNQGA